MKPKTINNLIHLIQALSLLVIVTSVCASHQPGKDMIPCASLPGIPGITPSDDHAAISVAGNDGFVNWTGTGTSSDPYLVTANGVFNTTTIYLEDINAHVIIRDCRITGNTTGTVSAITLVNCSNVVLQNVTIANFKTGLSLNRSHHVYMNGATITRCAVGVHAYGSYEITIDQVTASDNSQRGVWIDESSHDITIQRCTLRSNIQGIAVIESSKNVVYNNTITYNTYGLFLEFGHDNILANKDRKSVV